MRWGENEYLITDLKSGNFFGFVTIILLRIVPTFGISPLVHNTALEW